MSIHFENRDQIAIFRPTGRLDSASSPELEGLVNTQLEAGARNVVFDLADLDYISSAGLRVVLLAGKKLRASQGRLLLAGLRDNVRDVFAMSGFLSLFNVVASVDDAVTALR